MVCAYFTYKMKNLVFSFLCLVTSFSFSQTWNTVGGGTDFSGNGVRGFCVKDDKLWVIGEFLSVAGATIPSMGKVQWDSLNWIPDNTPFTNGYPNCIALYNNEIHLGGTFRRIDNNPLCRRIGKWNGTSWLPLGKGITDGNRIYALQSYNGDLYVGGQFIEVDSSIVANRIARWDGSQWYAMGTGFTGGITTVFAIAVYNGELYVGGEFSSIDGVTAYNICKWNGTTWSALGGGVNGFVRSFTVDTINNILYIGGQFNLADTVNIPTGVAAWNGTSFSAVGTAPFLSPVAMCMYQNKLWAGGAQSNITNNLGDSINELSWFNGVEWMPAYYHSDHGEVEALIVYKDELYVGGYSDTINHIFVNKIAKTYTPSLNSKDLIEVSKSIIIQPNPADDQIVIKITRPAIKPSHWKIVNSSSIEIKKGKIQEQEFVINTKKILQGIYFLGIFDGENILKKEKIVIIH